MDDYPSNSRNQNINVEKNVPKKIERVVEGKVLRRKQSMGKRFVETFAGANAKNVGVYTFQEIVIPAIKDLAQDAVATVVERMLFGDSRPSRRRSNGTRFGGNSGSHIDYRSFSSNNSTRYGRDEQERPMSRKARTIHNFDEIILDSRAEADTVLNHLFDLIQNYEVASVSDLYEMCGVQGSYTDDKYGWQELHGASISKVREGYLLNLPKPVPIV